MKEALEKLERHREINLDPTVRENDLIDCLGKERVNQPNTVFLNPALNILM